jgi:3-dehydroquinate dehydratase II
VAATAAKFDLWVRAVQSSHEGVLIDAVHEAHPDRCGIVINPGGFEVHLTNVYRREPYRHHSYVSAIADAVIAGAGPLGYDAAVRYLAATATGGDAVAPPA